jgi:hypothetical protein
MENMVMANRIVKYTAITLALAVGWPIMLGFFCMNIFVMDVRANDFEWLFGTCALAGLFLGAALNTAWLIAVMEVCRSW